jgi:putative membrane-bound dehydrogenase-like protein
MMLLLLIALSSDEHLTPAESLAKIKLPPGYVVELAACEPNVESPVAISFDEFGRMFVAEYRDYPTGPKPGEPPLSRIRLLEDKDGDGFFEKATVFADKLSFAQGVLAYNGGLIVTAAPHILFLKDTTGDGIADEKTIWFTGFKEGNPQLRVSHPKLGLDHKVYVANGLSGGEIRRADGKGPAIKLDRDDFCFDPRTLDGEACTGFGQFGNTFDDWGRRFTCSNRNPVIHSFLPKRVLNRNDQILIPIGYGDVAPSGADSRVYPIASTETTAESHAGTHTAACGVHVYRGDLCPDLRGDVFVCEPTGFLVTRSKLIPHGAGFRTERDRPHEDFMASTDKWFRPVSLSDGPDGALYVVDMHREVIEHPDYLPKGVGKNLRWRAGAEKGRILRIKPTGAKMPLAWHPRGFKPPRTIPECLSLISDWNGWRRDLGQRLLIEKNAQDAIPELRRLIQNPITLAPTHAVWTLSGLHSLSVEDLLAITQHKGMEEAALLAGEQLFRTELRLHDRACDLAASTLLRTTMFAAIAIGDFDHPRKAESLGLAAVRNRGFDPWVGNAVLSASAKHEGRVFQTAIGRRTAHTQTAEFLDFIAQLCATAVHRDEAEMRAILTTLGREKVSPEFAFPWQVAGLAGLAEGFQKPNPWKTTSLFTFLHSPPKSLEKEAAGVRPLLAAAEQSAFHPHKYGSRWDRPFAIELVASKPALRDKILELVGGTESSEIQISVLNALGGANSRPVLDRLVSRWPTLPPPVQSAAVDFCFKRRDSQLQFLKAIEAKKIPASVVGFERREMMLVFSNDKEIKPLAQKLFRAAASNRAAVIDQYSLAIKKPGDSKKGLEVFKRVCMNCHRLKGIGTETGPPLADVRQKTKETLLADILDPNRTFEPRFGSSIAVLKDGRTVVGILTSDSGNVLTLQLANGQKETIARNDVETLRSSGRSLMPEGVEKDVSPEQMNDLLEFLKAPN